MIKRLVYVLLVFLVTSICQKAYAFGMPSSKPLPQIITQSQTIVFASLTAYHSDVSPTNSTETSSAPIGAAGPSIFTSRPVKPAGHYTFHIIAFLKGGSPTTVLNVNLPYILGFYYPGSALSIQNGSKFIVFLNTGSDGQFIPTDVTTPFMPLSASVTLSKDHDSNLEESIYGLMLAACVDAKMRGTESYFLRTVINPSIVAGLLPYIDDKDLYTRDSVLTCMASNQQVAAIPRIVALNQIMKAGGGGAESASTLDNYQSPEALPYLNPLSFSSDYYIRLKAISGIDNLVNRTSIPYLMLAIRDPDYQNVIPPVACRLLHQLNPSLGRLNESSYFLRHRTTETSKLFAWWSDELLGKHLKLGEHPVIPAELPYTPALLNPLLFIPNTPTRRAVADKLARIGDKSSIPYLVLALQDPDPQQNDGNVSYVAYKTLHRLIPALGPAETSIKFAASPETAKQPTYQWWQEELMGKHLTK